MEHSELRKEIKKTSHFTLIILFIIEHKLIGSKFSFRLYYLLYVDVNLRKESRLMLILDDIVPPPVLAFLSPSSAGEKRNYNFRDNVERHDRFPYRNEKACTNAR